MSVSVLCFRGLDDGRSWHLSALLVVEDEQRPAPLVLSEPHPDVAPVRLGGRLAMGLWRYDFEVTLGDEERTVDYGLGRPRWTIHLPALSGPVRIAFTACNGSEFERTGESEPGRNALWQQLHEEHERQPLHLLLHGGDQLYADSVWDEVEELAAWQRLRARQRLEAPFPAELEAKVADYYFRRYVWLWEQKELAPTLPSIPSLMMWDDHDIFDNFGSHDPEWQACPVFRGIYRVAREQFALFQLVARPDDLPARGFADPAGGHFGWSYRIVPGIGVVAPDLRSERSTEQIMGAAGHRALGVMLDELADCRHVLFLSTVPLLNAHEHWFERLYEAIPGHQSFQNDIRDQWRSLLHRQEWRDLLELLFGFIERTGARLTAVSGEIHVGGLATATWNGRAIWQLTSSGIVHPPPPMWLVHFLDWMSTGPAEEIEPGLHLELLEIPGLGQRYLGRRNWLALDLSPASQRIDATWHTENGTFSLQSEDDRAPARAPGPRPGENAARVGG
ncbi:MAG: alkaline phosphatase D family protein [Geminicoccaceae bacterium]|nr:alkaline phosphatase D family protein [Geminicoccaceae bacterium]